MKSSPNPTAMASACTTSASASARRPAPSARAIAAEIPPPTAPADIICISISAGKTRATPASASVPSLPTKYVSMRPTEAYISMTSTFGVASRRSVLVIDPSSRTRVRGSSRCAVAAGGASSGRDPTSVSTASRMLGASVSRGLEGRVRTATEHDAGDAAGHRPPRDGRVPGEQAQRAAILRQHVGAELMNAALLSRTKDFLEEERAEAESLPAVRHDEADVGSGPFIRRAVPRHADQLGLLPVVDSGDDRHSPAIVDVGEGVRFLRKEPPEREESLVDRAWAQPTAQRHEARLVVGRDRADAHGGAVAQCHALFRVGQVSWDLDGHADDVSGSRVYDALQHGLGRCTEDPVDDRALLEEQDRRDRPDPIPSRQPRILVDIDLHQRHPTFRGRGQLLEGGRDRPTWTAPLCPEVDHHETLVREQRLVEVLLGQVESLGYSVLKGSRHHGLLLLLAATGNSPCSSRA